MGSKRASSFELFPTDSPVVGGALIGRREEVLTVASTLEAGGNLIIAGPRRTGKTSVALSAAERCRERGCYVATADLFRLADEPQLAGAVATAALANRPPLKRAIDAARRGGGRLAEAVTSVAARRALGDLELDLRLLERPRAPGDGLAHALELADRIAAADGRRMVLVLDEFQEIASARAPYGDPDRVTKQMRAVLQDAQATSVLFSGSMQHLMRDLFAPTERAFSQFGAFHELEGIDRAVWAAGITERLERDGCAIDDTALTRILDAAADHPRAIMLVAQQAHLLAVQEGTRHLDDALVAAGVDAALRADRLKHEQTLELIRRLSRHGVRVATRVATGDPPYEGLPSKVAGDTLRALRDAGIVETAGARQGWSVVDPLLGRFLAALADG